MIQLLLYFLINSQLIILFQCCVDLIYDLMVNHLLGICKIRPVSTTLFNGMQQGNSREQGGVW